MSDRLTDEQVADIVQWSWPDTVLAREVQASRKLIADLLALPESPPWGDAYERGYADAMSAVLRLIEEAGL